MQGCRFAALHFNGGEDMLITQPASLKSSNNPTISKNKQ